MQQPVTPLKWDNFNHAALRDILNDLEIPYTDGWSNMMLRCFMDTTCMQHRKETLYLKCDDDNAGIWKCFRCDRRGFVDDLVRAWQGWDNIKTIRYLSRHQAYEDPNDCVRRTHQTVSDGDLNRYAYRHPYLYDRGLDEETCLRFQIGFDQDLWMITIPIFTPDHKLAAIKKRAIVEKNFQHLSTEYDRFSLFGIDHIKPRSIVWVAEGEIDAMFVDQMLRAYDFQNQGAIALSGAYLVDRGLEYLIDLEPVAFVNALDNDSEGQIAAQKLRARLAAVAPVVRLQYESEQTKDPNESTPKHLAAQARRAAAFVTKGTK